MKNFINSITKFVTASLFVATLGVQVEAQQLTSKQLSLVEPGTVAAVGTSQGTAAALNPSFSLHYVSGSLGSGVILPPCSSVGKQQTVYNSGTAQVAVYPFSGDTISQFGINNSTIVVPKSTVNFICIATGQWNFGANLITATDPIVVTPSPGGGFNIALDPYSPLNNPVPALGSFGSGTFTPTLTSATPGDLSVVYTTQLGWYYKSGNLMCVGISLAGTPTYTSASGNLQITGIPKTGYPLSPDGNGSANLKISNLSGFTWPSNALQPFLALSTSAVLTFVSNRVNLSSTNWAIGTIPSNTSFIVKTDGCYITAQ